MQSRWRRSCDAILEERAAPAPALLHSFSASAGRGARSARPVGRAVFGFARACTRLLKIVLALSCVRAVGRPPASRALRLLGLVPHIRTPSACDALELQRRQAPTLTPARTRYPLPVWVPPVTVCVYSATCPRA
eukprot:scaffold124625_cov48-Phaeocystis_antarctica.AAC.1